MTSGVAILAAQLAVRTLTLPVLALSGVLLQSGFAVSAESEGRIAILQGLDKITARVSRIEAPIDQKVSFGTLSIVVKSCSKRPPEEPPEVAAFLQIDENRPGPHQGRAFSGWMFASSPAISALEHPVYDIWVSDCKTAAGSSSPRNR